MKVFSLLVGVAAAFGVFQPTSGQNQAEMIRGGGAKVDHMSDITPVCSEISCGETPCPAPFELRRAEGACCATCYAPDHVVAIDRHTAMAGGSPYKAKVAPAAPGSCAGVKCFTPACRVGETVGHVPGRCCLSCK